MKHKSLSLSANRRFICDLMAAARAVPSVPVERRMDLRRLKAARDALASRPSWAAVFVKAYATVARRTPEFRRAYVKFPWPRLCEYDDSAASIAVERDYRGEKAVFFGRVRGAADMTVTHLTNLIHAYQTVPVDECPDFTRILRLSRLPYLLRKVGWWFALNSGRLRGKSFGTFALSVYARPAAQSLHPLSPCTGTLNYGLIDDAGRVTVRLVYDHRVLDGSAVARFLEAVEDELNGPLAGELAALAAAEAGPSRRPHAPASTAGQLVDQAA